jgi:sugar/nucleoside kinase (ribokinase family)
MYASGAEERSLDVVPIGELAVDFISIEETGTLENATTFRRHLGGSSANIAVYVSKLGAAAVITKIVIGAFGKRLKSQLGRHGVLADYRIMNHRTNTIIVFVSSTSGTPNFEEFRSGDHLFRWPRPRRKPWSKPAWFTPRPPHYRGSGAALWSPKAPRSSGSGRCLKRA